MAKILVNCACAQGMPSYLALFATEERRDQMFSRYGMHPRLFDLRYEYWLDTGSEVFPESWRVFVTATGLLFYEDAERVGMSANDVLQRCGHMTSLAADLRVVGALFCKADAQFATPLRDGFCYLSLYPRSMWAGLASSLGPWPTLSALPPGRYPAVAKQVVSDFVKSLALHCERAVDEGHIDELARFPGIACVGGGQAGVSCANLNRVGGSRGVCGDCLEFTRRAESGPGQQGFFLRMFPGVAYDEPAHLPLRAGLSEGATFLVRGDFPDAWRNGDDRPVVRLRAGEAKICSPTFERYGTYTGAIAVTAERWAMRFPIGARLAVGPYSFSCSQVLTVIGSGPAVVFCSGVSAVPVCGLTARVRDFLMHVALGCDPTDTTARFMSRLGCNVYYTSRNWYGLPAEAVKVARNVDDHGSLSYSHGLLSRDLDGGDYLWKLPPDGLIVKALKHSVRVDDMVAHVDAAVCLVYGRAARRDYGVPNVVVWAGCDPVGRPLRSTSRISLDALARTPGMQYVVPPGQGGPVLAVAYRVDDVGEVDGFIAEESDGSVFSPEFT